MTQGRTVCYSEPLEMPNGRMQEASRPSVQVRFLRCLATTATGAHLVALPEYYSSATAYADLARYGERHIHLIFRATDQIRLLKRGYNIVYFAWHLPFITDRAPAGGHPFSNQKHMLALCDEIWVPCEYTKTMLERHGLENVHIIPAPVAVSTLPKLARRVILARLGHLRTQSFYAKHLGGETSGPRFGEMPLYISLARPTASGRPRKIYLSVFEALDAHKNIDALIRGFDGFVQHGRDDLLIIKIPAGTDRLAPGKDGRDWTGNGSSFDCDNILVLDEELSADETTLLYDLADFYLCTSSAEEQNLPLIEAMSRGIVAITTRNTAMLDYIDATNALIIATTLLPRSPAAPGLAGAGAPDIAPVPSHACTWRRVIAALEASAALTAPVYAQLSAAARERAREHFSEDAVSRLMMARLAV